MKKNPIVAIKVFKFGRAWRLVIEHKDGPDTVTNPKTFLTALRDATLAWMTSQPTRPERREIPASCRPDSCGAICICQEGCSQWDILEEFRKWIRDHDAVRVGTSFVYEARR